LRYAALSAELVAIAVAAIRKIPGSASIATCPVPGLHPPATLPQVLAPGSVPRGFGGAGGAAGGPGGATVTTAPGAAGAGANGAGTNCDTSGSTTTTTKPAASSTTTTTKPVASSTTATSTTKPAASTTTTTIDCATTGSGAGAADLKTQLAAAAGSRSSG